jgi:PPP family 3-phenylpropionic acid transporter
VSAAFRLSLFYAGFFFAAGVQLPYWPVWLASRGLGAGEIGALLALSQWLRVAASPPLGLIADRMRDRRRFMTILGVLALAGYGLCLPAHGFAALVLPSALVAASSAALLPLADSSALNAAASARLDYGRVRLWGTIAFILATLVGGRLLSGRGADIVLYLLLAASAFTAAGCVLVPHGASAPRADKPPPWRSLLDRKFMLFLAAAALIQSSHAVYYAFGTLYWQRLGFSDGAIAGLWAEGAVAEVALFYFGAPLVRRCGPSVLMALGGAGALVRWSATALATSLPALVALQPLHALSFAAAHLGAMHFIQRRVSPERAVTAQSLYAAVVSGLGFGIAALAAGALYGAFGGGAYFAMAAMAALGAALALRLGAGPRAICCR